MERATFLDALEGLRTVGQNFVASNVAGIAASAELAKQTVAEVASKGGFGPFGVVGAAIAGPQDISDVPKTFANVMDATGHTPQFTSSVAKEVMPMVSMAAASYAKSQANMQRNTGNFIEQLTGWKEAGALADAGASIATDLIQTVTRVPNISSPTKLNIVAGPSRIDVNTLIKATNDESEGFTPRQIIDKHGIWKGLDGEWRKWISDENAQVIKDLKTVPNNTERTFFLEDVLKHNDLYDEYPHLRKVIVKVSMNEKNQINGSIGQYDPADRSITLFLNPNMDTDTLNTLVHEAQHSVQEYEGISGGTNPDTVMMQQASAFASDEHRITLPELAAKEAEIMRKDPESIELAYIELARDALHDTVRTYRNTVGEREAFVSGDYAGSNISPDMVRRLTVKPPSASTLGSAPELLTMRQFLAAHPNLHGRPEILKYITTDKALIEEFSKSNPSAPIPKSNGTMEARIADARAFHGAGSNFDKMDSKYMGTGEGQQVYGWGHYTGDRIKTGESYWKDRKNDSPSRRDQDAGDKIPHIMQVEIPDPHEEMVWGKPMRDQDPDIREKASVALTELEKVVTSLPYYAINGRTDAETFYRNISSAWENEVVRSPRGETPALPSGFIDYVKSQGRDGVPIESMSGDEFASHWLAYNGIKGHRFADGFTRHKTDAKKTYNHVTYGNTVDVVKSHPTPQELRQAIREEVQAKKKAKQGGGNQ